MTRLQLLFLGLFLGMLTQCGIERVMDEERAAGKIKTVSIGDHERCMQMMRLVRTEGGEK